MICPAVTVAGSSPRSSAVSARRSLLANPSGCSRNSGSAASRAWLRCCPSCSPGMWVPVLVVIGAVTLCRASAPVIGSQLSDWTRSRRLLAEKPISRSAGRLVSRLPIEKSVVSLMVVRSVMPSLVCGIA